MKLTPFILAVPLIWLSPSFADAPEGMVPEMVPLRAMCLPASVDPNHFTTVIGALTEDFAVHVSMTFSASATQKVAIVENPDTNLAGVLMITPNGTCVAFSGRDVQHFDRPSNMKPPEIDVHKPQAKEDVES